jgi:hypothetical protein
MDTKQILAEIDHEIACLTQARALLTDTNSNRTAPKRGPISAEGRKQIARGKNGRNLV